MNPLTTLGFCPQLEEIYTTRKIAGRTGKQFDGMGGLSTENNIHTLRTLLMELKPEATLEVGMAYGGSALAIAQCHLDLGRPAAYQHVAIDPEQSTYWDDIGRISLERAGLEGYVDVRETTSLVALPRLLSEGRRYGLIYVDGSHQFEDVLLDFVYAHELLEIGGLILFDDSTDSQIIKVLRFIEANYNEHYQRISLSSHRTGLARLKYVVAERLHKNQLTAYRKLKNGRPNWGGRLRKF